MVTARYLFATLAICATFNFVIADEDKKEETDDAKPSSGLLNGILGAADDAKDKMEGGMDVLKGYTSVAKELTEEGAKKAQSFAEDMGDSFSAGLGKVAEAGSKIKEAVGDAMLNTKDEFETAASKVAEHAKDAVGTFSKLLG
ncbi:uncharacterized protein TNIN_463261 [Trichonephila inaurata madagascariensis]|uniref:Uncharacterized protein n=1 Tax=Trichonephila inaurata madagascariensis TaxID=2747483 RepID=A0A8X6XUW5_9ARAC|nr:uncharacterized protein TNIN_463261 [Trichonephila inaurata madagascariensis]